MLRSSVDLPVPGGPSSTVWQPCSSATDRISASRRRPTTIASMYVTGGLVLVDDDPPDVLAGLQIGVALVDLRQLVLLGDELVELELAGAIQREHLLDVVGGIAVAEQRTLDVLAVQHH